MLHGLSMEIHTIQIAHRGKAIISSTEEKNKKKILSKIVYQIHISLVFFLIL